MRARAQPGQGMGGGAACCAGRGQRPERRWREEPVLDTVDRSCLLLDAHVKRTSLGSRGVRAGLHLAPGSLEEAPQSGTALVAQGSGFSPPSLESSSLQVCGSSALILERNAADKAASTSLSAAQRCPSRNLQGKELTMGERASRCLPPPRQ